jgi:hypothetical protein
MVATCGSMRGGRQAMPIISASTRRSWSRSPRTSLAATSPSMVALNQVTRSVPVVFVQVADPIGAGFVASLARPGGNASGFTIFEYGVSGKWVELLAELPFFVGC